MKQIKTIHDFIRNREKEWKENDYTKMEVGKSLKGECTPISCKRKLERRCEQL